MARGSITSGTSKLTHFLALFQNPAGYSHARPAPRLDPAQCVSEAHLSACGSSGGEARQCGSKRGMLSGMPRPGMYSCEEPVHKASTVHYGRCQLMSTHRPTLQHLCLLWSQGWCLGPKGDAAAARTRGFALAGDSRASCIAIRSLLHTLSMESHRSSFTCTEGLKTQASCRGCGGRFALLQCHHVL